MCYNVSRYCEDFRCSRCGCELTTFFVDNNGRFWTETAPNYRPYCGRKLVEKELAEVYCPRR